MPRNKSNVTVRSDDLASSPAERDSFCFNNQHCFNCYVRNSDIDHCLMECGRCKKFYYCGIACFNAHLDVHMKYCQTGKIYREPMRRSAAVLKNASQQAYEKKMKAQSVVVADADVGRPSDRLWAALDNSSSDSESSDSGSSDDSDSDSFSSCSSDSSVATFVESACVNDITEEGTGDEDDDTSSDACWSDMDEDEINPTPVSLIEAVESDDDSSSDESGNGVSIVKHQLGNAVVRIDHSTLIKLPVSTSSGKDSVIYPRVESQIQPVDSNIEDVVTVSGGPRYGTKTVDDEEIRSANGRARVGTSEWEETEVVNVRRGSAIIPQELTRGIVQERRSSYCGSGSLAMYPRHSVQKKDDDKEMTNSARGGARLGGGAESEETGDINRRPGNSVNNQLPPRGIVRERQTSYCGSGSTSAYPKAKALQEVDDGEEIYSANGRARISSSKWEETEAVTVRRGGAVIHQESLRGIVKERRSSYCGSGSASVYSKPDIPNLAVTEKDDKRIRTASVAPVDIYGYQHDHVDQPRMHAAKAFSHMKQARRMSDVGVQVNPIVDTKTRRQMSLPQPDKVYNPEAEEAETQLRHVELQRRPKPTTAAPEWYVNT
jgi:hypothetical protein